MPSPRERRRERRLKVENWKEQNHGWYNVYKGTRRALRQYPVNVKVRVYLPWRDIALGVLVGAFPYALLMIYLVERL